MSDKSVLHVHCRPATPGSFLGSKRLTMLGCRFRISTTGFCVISDARSSMGKVISILISLVGSLDLKELESFPKNKMKKGSNPLGNWVTDFRTCIYRHALATLRLIQLSDRFHECHARIHRESKSYSKPGAKSLYPEPCFKN